VPFDTVYGAAHGMDLPFLFGNFGPSTYSYAFSTANAPGRVALSNAMMDTLARSPPRAIRRMRAWAAAGRIGR
jgi:hypothetical protein